MWLLTVPLSMGASNRLVKYASICNFEHNRHDKHQA